MRSVMPRVSLDRSFPVQVGTYSARSWITGVRNLAATRAEGMDLRFRVRCPKPRRSLSWGSSNHLLPPCLRRLLLRTSDYLSILDTVGSPARFRAHASLQWSERGRLRPGFGVITWE